jgi:hypothetical protein
LLSRRASWLLHRLSLSSRCAALPSSHCTSWFLHRLSSSSCCAPLLSSHCTGWLLHRLLMRCLLVLLLRCPLILSARQLIVVSPLVILLLRRPLVLSLRRLVVALSLLASPSCPLYVDAGCGAKERRGGETDQKILNPSFKNFARARMKLGASFRFRLDPRDCVRIR